MTKRNIAYWVSTGLVATVMAAGGAFDLSGAPAVAETLSHLGYPAYFALILGVWKLLAAPALLSPGMARLKEWAYAGIVFDLSGAALSHAFAADPADKIVVPVVLLALTVTSWALRPASRMLVARSDARPAAAAQGVLSPRPA